MESSEKEKGKCAHCNDTFANKDDNNVNHIYKSWDKHKNDLLSISTALRKVFESPVLQRKVLHQESSSVFQEKNALNFCAQCAETLTALYIALDEFVDLRSNRAETTKLFKVIDERRIRILEQEESTNANEVVVASAPELLPDEIKPELDDDEEGLYDDDHPNSNSESDGRDPEPTTSADVCASAPEEYQNDSSQIDIEDAIKTEPDEQIETQISKDNDKSTKSEESESDERDDDEDDDRTDSETETDSSENDEDERPYRCDIEYCKRRFKTELAVKCHKGRDHYEIRLKCSECLTENIFSTNEDYMFHIVEGHPHLVTKPDERLLNLIPEEKEKLLENQRKFPFKCSICSNHYCRRKQSLTAHLLRVHLKDLSFKCTQNNCAKSFYSEQSLRSHIKKCHDEKPPNICDECGKSFSTRANLQRHQQGTRKHANSNTKLYPCIICSKDMTTKISLKGHLHVVHGIGPNTYGWHVSKRKRISKPRSENSGPKRPSINKTSGLPRRPRTMRPEGYLYGKQCPICNKVLSSKWYTELHVKFVHENVQRPLIYSCKHPGCSKMFANPGNAQRHMLVHQTKVYNHKCDLCEKVYYCTQSLHQHKYYVHGGKPWPRKNKSSSSRSRKKPSLSTVSTPSSSSSVPQPQSIPELSPPPTATPVTTRSSARIQARKSTTATVMENNYFEDSTIANTQMSQFSFPEFTYMDL